MSPVHQYSVTTLSRRGFLSLSVGAALAVSAVGRVRADEATPSSVVTTANGRFLDAGFVHEIAASFDQDAYDAMIETFSSSGDKDWIEADVTIDGATYTKVGMRLKGNSSLMGLRNSQRGGVQGSIGGGASADTPEGLPWLVRLDKYQDDQNHDRLTEFVIRSNNSATSLNEAVSLELLADAGLESQLAASTAFSVNGSARALRLVIENPDDAWMAVHFSKDGLLFKSEAEGDWSYRGDDHDDYKDSFDLEAGGTGDDSDDYAPLIAFLDFVNNSDDVAFVAELPQRLDVDKFAVYLAMMDLIGNFDDVSGPGNNSYLYDAPDSEQFTVVPWDMNLAFGGMGRMGGGFPANGDRPDGTDLPAADQSSSGTPVAGDGPPDFGQRTQNGAMGGGPNGRSNPLASRFNADAGFAALVTEASTRLRTDLYDSGAATAVLARWVGVLESGATAMVDQATITSESEAIASFFTSST